MKGQRLSAGRAWFRQVSKLATLAMSGLGYLPAMFTVKAQTIHDILARTLVVSGQSEKTVSYGAFACASSPSSPASRHRCR